MRSFFMMCALVWSAYKILAEAWIRQLWYAWRYEFPKISHGFSLEVLVLHRTATTEQNIAQHHTETSSLFIPSPWPLALKPKIQTSPSARIWVSKVESKVGDLMRSVPELTFSCSQVTVVMKFPTTTPVSLSNFQKPTPGCMPEMRSLASHTQILLLYRWMLHFGAWQKFRRKFVLHRKSIYVMFYSAKTLNQTQNFR